MESYLYTGNNPIMFTDPTGMSKVGYGGGDPNNPPNRFPRINHFFSIKSSFSKGNYYANFNTSTLKSGLSTDWGTSRLNNEIVNGFKKIALQKLFKHPNKKLTPEKKGVTLEQFGKIVNKMTDIEIKYRILNYSTVEGQEWYGDVWYNDFTDDITKINYKGSSETKDFFLFTEDTIIQEGIFLKGQDNPIIQNNICQGEDCRDKHKIMSNYIKKEELDNSKNLPKENYDIRNENN